jgi:hypothetical protein
MKRAGRILHRLLTALSLLLLLATAGIWVRSYWVSDALNWYDWPADRSFFDQKSIRCSRGGVRFDAWRRLSAFVQSPGDVHFQHQRHSALAYPVYGDELNGYFSSEPPRYAALGFEWIPETATSWAEPPDNDGRLYALTVPLYFPCLLFALLPAHYLLHFRRRWRIARRIALGCCIGCGYDLRATPGRCPECGNLPPSGVA